MAFNLPVSALHVYLWWTALAIVLHTLVLVAAKFMGSNAVGVAKITSASVKNACRKGVSREG